MLNKRITRLCLIIALLMLALVPVASAKGMANRIVMTFPSGEELIVTDAPLVNLLSMGRLEDFDTLVEELPERAVGPYTLERQWDDGTSVMTIDVVEYYDYLDKGIVLYRGLANGWTDYDGNYYLARPEGVAAIDTIINFAERIPYFLTTNDNGAMRVYDVDLNEVSRCQVHDDGLIHDIQSTFSGELLSYRLRHNKNMIDSNNEYYYALDFNLDVVYEAKPLRLYLTTPEGREFVQVEGDDFIQIIFNVFDTIEYGEEVGSDGVTHRRSVPKFSLSSPNMRLYPDQSRGLIYGVDVRQGQLTISQFELWLQTETTITIDDAPAIGHYNASWATEYDGDFFVTNGLTLYEMPHWFGNGFYDAHELEWDGRETIEQGKGVVDFAGVRSHMAYLYVPYSKGMDFDGIMNGIAIVNTSTGKQVDKILTGHAIMDAVLDGDVLYVIAVDAVSVKSLKGGLENPEAQVRLLKIGLNDGAILDEVALPAHDWLISQVKAVPGTFESLDEVSACRRK